MNQSSPEHDFSRRSFLKFMMALASALGFTGVAPSLVAPPVVEARTDNAPAKIYLANVHIAGTTHVKNIESLSRHLHEGTRLDLARDYNNTYDKYATLVLDEYGTKVGFLPQKDNRIIARMIDGGKSFHGEIVKKEWRGSWLRITINLYLDEK